MTDGEPLGEVPLRLEKFDDKQRDRLLDYDDGQTILSVLLGLKPALIVGLRPYRRPLDLIKAISTNLPGQFELSNNFFYNPRQVRQVIAENTDLFLSFLGRESSSKDDHRRNGRYTSVLVINSPIFQILSKMLTL